jgi:EmrB/QacA subfamily drug resistance transporter
MSISAAQPTKTSTSRNTSSSYKWLVALVIVFGLFASIMDATIVNIAIPSLQSVFGGSLSTVQWVLTGYTLVQGIATPLTPFLANRLGAKRLYLIGLATFTTFSALCGLAWSLPALIFFRLLQGLGGACLMPISIVLLYSVFPPQERGMAMGLMGVPLLFAPALGPTLGGYLITYASWQLIFYINVPIGIIGFILGMLLLRDVPREARMRFDLAGFLLVAVGLGTVLYGFSQVSTDGWDSTIVLGCLGVGLVSLLLFVLVELERIDEGRQPLLNLRIFADRAFTPSIIASSFVTFILFGGLFMVPLYLQSLRGLSPFQSGLLLLPQALVSVVVAVVGGRLTDKFGTVPIVLPGLLILAYPLWGLTHLTTDTPYSWFQALLIMRGLEMGLVAQPLMRASLVRIPPGPQLNQATALSTVSRFITSSISTAILGTYVQTQQKIHYTHLALQVVPGTPQGQFVSTLQALFQKHGMSTLTAHNAAILEVIRLVQQQGYALALQDGFVLTLWTLVPALIAVLLLPKELRRPIKYAKKGSADDAEATLHMAG